MVVDARDGQATTEAAMSESTYQGLCELIFRHSRIHLGANRQSMLVCRLNSRRQYLGLKSWNAYFEHLSKNQNGEELGKLIDLVATNHTQFFREKLHFDRLRSEIIDTILKECSGATTKFLAWSAASSSGEEPFSLAITINEHFSQRTGPSVDWMVYASDISRKTLKVAEAAIYPSANLNLPNPEWLRRYFKRGSGPYEGQCRVKPEILKHVRFQHINLFQRSYPLPQPLHLIFCRNVLIYFEQESQAQLVARLHSMLTPGGFLIVGHSDSLNCFRHDFAPLGGGVYRRNT